MAQESTETTAVVFRDGEGTLYLVSEDTIRACRATPEQQQALRDKIGEDVVGYGTFGAGFTPVGVLAPVQVSGPQISVNPQTNVGIVTNVAAANFAPVSQVAGLGQANLNTTRFHG
jgi:hypothetical protein